VDHKWIKKMFSQRCAATVLGTGLASFVKKEKVFLCPSAFQNGQQQSDRAMQVFGRHAGILT